ncbi:Serpin domain [Trinorchestia longiramus]|nr:Serpin domain [Trinorchestia longiramus]
MCGAVVSERRSIGSSFLLLSSTSQTCTLAAKVGSSSGNPNLVTCERGHATDNSLSGVQCVVALSSAARIGMEHRSKCFYDGADLSGPASTDLSGITDFSLSLFKQLFPYTEAQNFFFSPYSIWSALSLAYFGSRGETEKQLRDALGAKDKVDTLRKWRELEFLYKMRSINKTEYIFNLANRAYFDKTVSLNPCLEKVLSSELVVDDLGDLGMADKINKWVSDTTKGRITELVKPSDLSNSNMVLTNAAFFKGTWLYQFKKSQTRKRLFYTNATDISFVSMMVQKGNFRHAKSEEIGAHILELPYTGESISMLIFLPPFITGDKGFDAMVDRLNSTTLDNVLNDLWRTEVEVSLPKFSLHETVGDELMGALQKMGVTHLFDRSLADLSDFSKDEQLSVGKSLHKAFVEVSEEGTEAAAATALISFRSARPAGPSKFECNHPFLFIIHDNVTKNVLFMGAYKAPQKSGKAKKF